MSVSKKTKALVAKRANYCCEYCFTREDFANANLSVDHIIPQSKSGDDHPDNLCYCCTGCNNYKYTFTEAEDPISGLKVSLYNPRTQKWQDHFEWSIDYCEIIGITTIGRATIKRLNLNRTGLRNLRKAMVIGNYHPPIIYLPK
jgi:hypothetical protein